MKIVKRLSIPTEILFPFRQLCLGDHNGEYAAVDDEGHPYYMGTKEECEQYIEDMKDIGDATSSYEDVKAAIDFSNRIKDE